MPIADAALTASLPRKAETAFLMAPQAAFGAPTYSGAQALHFTEFDPTRTQDPIQEREYGGATVGAAIDAPDVSFGDVSVTPPLQTNLCLNEIGFWLSLLLGEPDSTDLTGGKHQHVFTSGQAALPLATLILEDREGGRVLDSCVLGSLALALAQGGGRQICDFTLIARDLQRADTGTIDSGNAADPLARLFVPKNGWALKMDGTQVGRVLSAALNYNADLQTDRYLKPDDDTVGEIYVGDPTASLDFSLRHVSEAQRALFDTKDTPKAFELVGAAAGGHSITIGLPRAFVPPVHPSNDDRLQQLSSTATAARDSGSALTFTLVNSLAGY